MATGVQVSKAVVFAVVGPPEISASKAVVFAVVAPVPPGINVAKAVIYAVVESGRRSDFMPILMRLIGLWQGDLSR